MSESKIVCTHELVVRFEQHEDGMVSWLIQPDSSVDETSHASHEDLVRTGAPLAALGIRVLWEMLYHSTIQAALDKGNMYMWKECYMALKRQSSVDPQVIEGGLVSEAEEGVVIH